MKKTQVTLYRRHDGRPLTAVRYLSDDQIPELQEIFSGDLEVVIQKDRWDTSLLAVEIWSDTGLYKRQMARIGDWVVVLPNYNNVPLPAVYAPFYVDENFDLLPTPKKEETVTQDLNAYTVPAKFGKEECAELMAFLKPVFQGTGLKISLRASYAWSEGQGKELRGLRIYLPYGGSLTPSAGDTVIRYNGKLTVISGVTTSSPISITED